MRQRGTLKMATASLLVTGVGELLLGIVMPLSTYGPSRCSAVAAVAP